MSSSNKLPKCPCVPCSSDEKELMKLAKQHGVNVDQIKMGYAGGVNFKKVIKTPKSARVARAARATKAAKRNNKKKRGGGGGPRAAIISAYNYVTGENEKSVDDCPKVCCRPLNSPPTLIGQKTNSSSSVPPPPKSHSLPKPIPESLRKFKSIYDFEKYWDENKKMPAANNLIMKGIDVGKHIKLNEPNFSMNPKGKKGINEKEHKDENTGKLVHNYVFHKDMELPTGQKFVGYNSQQDGTYMPVIRNFNEDTHRHIHHDNYDTFRRGMYSAEKKGILIGKDTYNNNVRQYDTIKKRNQEHHQYGIEANKYLHEKNKQKFYDIITDDFKNKNHPNGTTFFHTNPQYADNPSPQFDFKKPHLGYPHMGQQYQQQNQPQHMGQYMVHGQGRGGKISTTRRVIKPTKGVKPKKPTKTAKPTKGVKPKKPKAIKIKKPTKTLRTKKAAPRKLKV